MAKSSENFTTWFEHIKKNPEFYKELLGDWDYKEPPKPPDSVDIERGLAAMCPNAASKMVRCPCSSSTGWFVCAYDGTIFGVITHLNDKHRWPREKIADWLDTLDLDLTIRERKDQKQWQFEPRPRELTSETSLSMKLMFYPPIKTLPNVITSSVS